MRHSFVSTKRAHAIPFFARTDTPAFWAGIPKAIERALVPLRFLVTLPNGYGVPSALQ